MIRLGLNPRRPQVPLTSNTFTSGQKTLLLVFFAGIYHSVFIPPTIHTELIGFRRGVHDADHVAWDKQFSGQRNYVYAAKSGTSTLRGHLERWHLREYLELVEARNWPIWLNSVKHAMGLGYSFVEMRQAVAETGSLDGLRARASATADKENSGGRSLLPAYSKEEFHKYLIAFIVADDQVRHSSMSRPIPSLPEQSINLMECREFRDLLLFLRESLCDSDIPHRNYLRNKIMGTWGQYIASLTKELGVSVIFSLCFIH